MEASCSASIPCNGEVDWNRVSFIRLQISLKLEFHIRYSWILFSHYKVFLIWIVLKKLFSLTYTIYLGIGIHEISLPIEEPWTVSS